MYRLRIMFPLLVLALSLVSLPGGGESGLAGADCLILVDSALDNTTDDGDVTLREAVEFANGTLEPRVGEVANVGCINPGADTNDFIVFSPAIFDVFPRPVITLESTITMTASNDAIAGGFKFQLETGVWVDGGDESFDCLAISNGSGNLISGLVIRNCASGVHIIGGFVRVGGAGNGSASGNHIFGNTLGSNGIGVHISGGGASDNTVSRNVIGLSADGLNTPDPNGTGVTILEAPNNIIGGTDPPLRVAPAGSAFPISNAISGNTGPGIYISGSGAEGTVITDNAIGTRADGEALPIPNGGSGIQIADADGTVIGGAFGDDSNVISGNGQYGIEICCDDSSGALVQGNLIGVSGGGGTAIPNAVGGMLVQISTGNIIGGETFGVRNVISGHDGPGIQVTDSAGLNAIGSNYIGTNSTGDDDVPNNSGIVVDNASELVIVGNVVSGNDGSGIVAQNSGATSNEIRQNLIGVAANGFSPLGNGEAGMSFYGTGPNLIGGDSPDDGNTIAHNGAAGIEVVPELPFSTGKAIQFNSIFANDGLGIDLAPDKSFEGDGVTPNDDQDGDFGGNALQNFPVLVSAAEAGGDVTVSGSLESQANSDYTLHFYANIECDPSGFGEGEFPSPTTIEVATDGNGHAEFQAEVDSEAGVGGFITATAQDEEGSTSEFSECVEITGATPTATPTATETPGPTPTPGTTATPGPTPTGTPGKGGLLGDTDCDEDIDSVDSLGVLREVAGLSFIVKCIAEGDVQCDGDRDSVDALGIQRHVAALPQISQEKGCRDIGT